MSPSEYGTWLATQTPPATTSAKQDAARIIAAYIRDKQQERAA